MEKAQAPYPYFGVNGAFYDKAFLDSAWVHLQKMAPLWAAGLDAPSPADRLAYAVLMQISTRRPGG